METYSYGEYKVEPLNGSYRIVNTTLGRPVVLEGLTLGWAETICDILKEHAETAFHLGFNEGYDEGYGNGFSGGFVQGYNDNEK